MDLVANSAKDPGFMGVSALIKEYFLNFCQFLSTLINIVCYIKGVLF